MVFAVFVRPGVLVSFAVLVCPGVLVFAVMVRSGVLLVFAVSVYSLVRVSGNSWFEVRHRAGWS